jgi:opacity protein-like surface antigen
MMKRILFAAVLLVLVSGIAIAGDFPKAEVFGGYSFTKVSGLEDITNSDTSTVKAAFGTPAPAISTPQWLKRGFTLSTTINVNQYLGFEASFQRNADEILKIEQVATAKAFKERDGNFSLLFGPRFALRKHKVFTPFAHVLFGFDRMKITPRYEINNVKNAGIPSLTESIDTGFGVALGGGIDAKVNKNVAVRIAQVDYVRAGHDAITTSNIVLSFGVVLRFGGK